MKESDFASELLKNPDGTPAKVKLSDKFFSMAKTLVNLPQPINDSIYGSVCFKWYAPKDVEAIKGSFYDLGVVFEKDGECRLVNTSNPLAHGCLQYTITNDSKISYEDILYWCLLKMEGFIRGVRGSGPPPEHVDYKCLHDIWEHYLMGAMLADKPITGVPLKSILNKRDPLRERYDSAEKLLIRSFNKGNYNFFKSLAKHTDPNVIYQSYNGNLKFLQLAVDGGLNMKPLIPHVSSILNIISGGSDEK